MSNDQGNGISPSDGECGQGVKVTPPRAGSSTENLLRGWLRQAWNILWRVPESADAGARVHHRLAHGAFWSLFGAAISRVCTLGAGIVAARLLGKMVFGEFGMVRSTVNMLGIFASLRLGLTSTKHVAELFRADADRAGRIMGLSVWVALVSGGLTAFVLVLLAPWLASHVINAPHLVNYIRIAAPILFVAAIAGTQMGALAGFEAFREIARVRLIVGVSAFPITVVLVWTLGLSGAIWALVCVVALRWLLSHVILRRKCSNFGVRVRYGDAWREWRVLLSFSLPAVLSGAIGGIVVWAASAMLVNQPSGYAELGIFNAANQWRVLLLFIPGILGQAIIPVLSSAYGGGDLKAVRTVLLTAVSLTAVIALPIAAALILFRGWVMSIYGSQFASGARVLVVVAFTAILAAIQTPVSQIIVASGRMWMGALMNAGWACILIGTVRVLVYGGHGAFGLAVGYLVAGTLHALWTLAFAVRIMRSGEVRRSL